MKQNTSIVLGLMLAFALAGVAQMTSPIPAPEMGKPDYSSGNWTEATIASGPWGTGCDGILKKFSKGFAP